ncbi:phosphate acetyltransferase [Acinetobacter sp. MD2]|uniref:phosphate acetyltransferase n=1 Tax=Acinetobacter sp. MD2 TaxID=2600066 RepID=UPI002D1EC355|nr:phosphate acetyltransferase [Acinetobacter sp. MD2]MEB3768269.1 phosphate acetyltransferase [Acinetobacter sp. MD2]
MSTLLLIPTATGVGLTSACLGTIYALEHHGIKAGFIKPFSQSQDSRDHGTASLYSELFNAPTGNSISHQILLNAIATDAVDELLEDAVRLHREIAKQYPLVIVEGLVATAEDYFANELNAQLAKALDAKVILVSKADLTQPQQSAKHVEASLRAFGGIESQRVAGVLFMRTKGLTANSAHIPITIDSSLRLNTEIVSFTTALQRYNRHIGTATLPIIGLVPFSNTLSVPRSLDIAEVIEATWLHQGDAAQRRIQHSSLIASSIEYELDKFVAGELIISASERIDVILAASVASQQGIPLAGLVLTERDAPHANILNFCQQAIQQGLPILHTALNTLETAQRLANLSNEVPASDLERAKQVCCFVASHLDPNWLNQQSSNLIKPRLSPAAFRYELVQKSIAAKKRIVLPEGDEPRTVEAAIICQSRGLANCILLAKPEAVQAVAAARGISLPEDLTITDPDSIRARYIAPMLALRKGKLDEIQAAEQLQDTVVLGTMMLALNEVDGLVSGAIHTTANTVRPAFQLIKTAPDYSLVSSIFFMLLPDEVYVYGDCAINPDPSAEQLAEIAIQSADSAIAFGIDPRIAMISYSTGSSGAGADVEKVAQATEIAKQRRPDLLIDGPLQYDAASVESVGRSKAPNSPVAGRANVFIFPDLNTGNTTYKAVQRSANVISVGPMLQGLNKPVNDLSRGALVDDIVFTIALTAIQAEQMR